MTRLLLALLLIWGGATADASAGSFSKTIPTTSGPIVISFDGKSYILTSGSEQRPLPGSIDDNILDAAISGGHVVCSRAACITTSGGETTTTDLPPDQGLVEIVGVGKEAFGLFARRIDDRKDALPLAGESVFRVCRIGGAGCEDVPADVIPYRLRDDGGRAAYSEARTASDFALMLAFDLDRASSNPWLSATDNRDGRIDWAVAYFLEALASIAHNDPGFSSDFAPVRSAASDKMRAFVAHLTSKPPAELLTSTRYSIGHVPMLSIMSFSRLARALARSRIAPPEAVAALAAEMKSPSHVIERVVTMNGRTELRVVKGSPIWSDGANVPWNFQSAYVTGLAAVAPLTNEAAAMVRQFAADEKLSSLPRTWHYAGGDFKNGWSAANGVSSNTPDWAGETGNIAHISYRSMDAIALVAAYRAGVGGVTAEMISHIARLVEDGMLYPHVLESLHPGERHTITFRAARLYARSATPSELQNQVWAIASLLGR